MFKDQKRFPELVDPLLKARFPAIGLNQAVGVAAMCLQEEASVRPLMADVVTALSFLTDGPPLSEASPAPSLTPNPPIPEQKPQYHPPRPLIVDTINQNHSNLNHSKSSCHGSSGRSSISMHLEESSRYSSMHSVTSDDSPNSNSNSHKVYFQHYGRADERDGQKSEHHLLHNASVHSSSSSSSSSSSDSHQESEPVFGISRAWSTGL